MKLRINPKSGDAKLQFGKKKPAFLTEGVQSFSWQPFIQPRDQDILLLTARKNYTKKAPSDFEDGALLSG